MKVHQQLLSYLVVLFISITACHKSVEVRSAQGSSTAGAAVVPPLREYFWGQSWNATSRGYEIHLETPRLTDSAIIRGINVGVAVYSDWDPFVNIPLDYYDYSKNDTIHLSYEVIPGKLNVIARALFAITYPSDVYIGYK